ncbi:MAG: hypothetical protein K2K96_02155 [Lachnospiraceae bacterium]|nr:hypothetical protein [Lachnospiraceae bacterium]
MRIPAVLGIESFCEKDKEVDAQAEAKMAAYVDNIFETSAENRPVIQTGICAIKGKLNEKLQEKSANAYEAAVAMTGLEEYEKLAGYDYELSCFQSAVKIYRMESDNHGNTIFDNIEYIDDFQVIFQQMIYYFRRIQLRLAKPLQKECMTYIKTKKLSVYAVIQILLDCGVGNQEDIAMVLADFYAEYHMYKEALFLLAVMIDQGDASYQESLTNKRDEYLGRI